MTTDLFQPGIYQIYSYAASSDIALDLSGSDLKSILGMCLPHAVLGMLTHESQAFLLTKDVIRRISWPNTALTIGLPEVESEPNTLARLVKIDSFGSKSLWRFVPQKFTPEAAPASSASAEAESALPVSLTTTDTKMEDNGDLTVKTTTTTVVTTVTKIAKTVASST
ncbi:hypothetical protein C0992_011636 [Termitomyces sp. T32_za158]|nr:hypothetical protein C0992_011636 [Termitomyces sp. T32_za158]